MRQDLDGELVAVVQELWRLLADTDTGGRAGQDDAAGGQGGALGQEADELGHGKDEVAGRMSVWRFIWCLVRRDVCFHQT